MIDHRRLGRELGIFHADPLCGAGLPIWLPDGAAARRAVEDYLYDLERQAGYQHVYSPPLGKKELFQRSGHLGHFAAEMFPLLRLSADDEFVLRPSLCPHHCLVFAARGRSWRELPLRVAEIGGMYRAERSGVLGGLSRVRAIHLNDAHTFCAAEQVGAEVAEVLGLIRRAHAALGIQPCGYRLSLRGPGRRYIGADDAWRRAEELLREALMAQPDAAGYQEAPGEAAFYGPKIDIQVRDAAGREWTLSTIQIDFDKPERFDLSYADRHGGRARPVLVHRSLVGSMERLFAYLLETHQGAFPAWYAPVQVEVLPVGAEQEDAAAELVRRCLSAGLRARVGSGGSLGARIRDCTRRRVPYAAVLGAREAADGRVALRLRDGRELAPVPVAEALEAISSVVAARAADLLPPL